ncbi:hypothetical protein ACFELO_12725 [Oceanicaulis sp. LC35]|uniref:hypothetical protein n=1 Tax=Oceanicaulis sp. LC35 TaxID=3349635 RepID=UPI003F843E25
MSRFFTRLLALLLSGSLLIVLLAVLLQIEPVGTGGWVVFALLAAGAVLTPVALYKFLMRGTRPKVTPRDAAGAGIAVGMGLEHQRQRQADEDADIDFDPQ